MVYGYIVFSILSLTIDQVVLTGDGSDEVASGYLYFHLAPSAVAAHEETMRLMSEMHMYDLLRAERCTRYHGLEIRLPFLEQKFIKYYMRYCIVLYCTLCRKVTHLTIAILFAFL